MSTAVTTLPQQEWEEITIDIKQLTSKLKLLETVHDPKFILEDGMHAHEINDNKIDPKHNISEKDTIPYMLKHKQVKLPAELTIEETIALFTEVLKREALIMMGNPLPQSIYQIVYMYDKEVYKNCLEIKALINSVNNIGSYIYELHRESCTIKEDDLTISSFSFSKDCMSNDEIVKMFQGLEAELAAKAKDKANQDKKLCYEQLGLMIKIRRSIHTLSKATGKYFDAKQQTKIEKELSNVQKAIDNYRATLSDGKDPSSNSLAILKETGIISENICKSLRTHFGPREITPFTLEESLKVIENSLQQFKLFIPTPNRYTLLRERIEQLHEMPINLWSKSYIKNNIFHTEEHIFNNPANKTQELIISDMNDYIGIKDSWKNTEEKFDMLTKSSVPVCGEVLFRYLGKNSRSFWEVSKIYEDFNILIHMSAEFDNNVVREKSLHVSSWYYCTGLNILIKQLFTGIETELYQLYELPYVLYILENFLGVFDKNAKIFLSNFDKLYQLGFHEGTLNHKKKKKFSETTRKYFSDAMFKRALHYYIRSLHRVIIIMASRNMLENPFVEELETKIKNRFRIFKNVHFVRTINYEQYKSDTSTICNDAAGYLQEAMDLLKEAKSLFQKFENMEENDCYTNTKEDSAYLVKACVKCSIAAMTLKMNQKGKTLKIENLHPRYPEVAIV